MLLPALPSASGPFVGPGDRYPNRQLKTKSVPVWLLADSQPHSLHSLKRFFWRRSIVINHFGSKGASPALPSAPPCTEARRGPILARKRWASGIAASTLSSSGAGPNPCSPTTKPEFPEKGGLKTMRRQTLRGARCIHQCRRKALSTCSAGIPFAGLRVHPSMSPKGVEHMQRQDPYSQLSQRASINVAERR